MANDALSQTLLGLSAWFHAVAEGGVVMTGEGMEAFDIALDRAAIDAIALEYRLDAALRRRPKTSEVQAAILSGKVAVLPIAPALVAVYPDLLAFNDDEGEPSRPSAPPSAFQE